jgi:hypothetical protein
MTKAYKYKYRTSICKGGGKMKYTRLELHSGLSKNTAKNIIIFFALIPVISICIGKMVTGLIVIPYIGKAIQPAQYTANIEDSNTDSEFYFLQAGVFSSRENADILQRGINNISKSTFIMNDADMFRVIVDISKNKSNLEEIQKSLKTSGYNCIINCVNFSSKNAVVSYSANTKTIIDLFELEYNVILNIQNNKEVSTEEILKQKSKIIDIYEKLKTDSKENNQVDAAAGKYDLIAKKTDEFIKNCESREINSLKGCISNQLFLFKNVYDKYQESK